ncbi:MAG: 2-amino-4-hydroxy-6-hydroxymethyldihydropteridine diphosphokinase [Candidatus Puniceispirillum sp.]
MTVTTVFIGVGANLTPEGYDSPRAGCRAALDRLTGHGIDLVAMSRWYESAPVPMSDQPWYLNAVAMATTNRPAAETLACLHQVEAAFGRVRGVRNAARVLDLDLIDFGGLVHDAPELILPHTRMHERAFVLLPMQELAPLWRHPISGVSIDDLVRALPTGQQIRLAK